jgi:hypothetical protein
MFVLCGNSALHSHILNIAVFSQQDRRTEVATSQFSDMHCLDICDKTGAHNELPANQVVHELSGKIYFFKILYNVCSCDVNKETLA